MNGLRARWVFDGLPPSGARRGGNPSEHAFRHDLATFVREVVQNANDQAQTTPRIVFRLRELRGDELSGFLSALDFDGLRPHLQTAALQPGNAAIQPTMQAIEHGALRVMYIEDHGTEGLTGAESEGESHFRALCKDTLFSHKKQASAGGSYGLGKSVLWVFSSLSTVVFDSTLMDLPPGQAQNPRFIGRAELPSHKVARGHEFAGSGWLGRSVRRGKGKRAESLWAEPAREHANALGFQPREDHDIGTSICIVGFRDPTADEAPSLDGLVARTKAAIVENFWPAMSFRTRGLRAKVGVEQDLDAVQPSGSSVSSFVEALHKAPKTNASLEVVGDVVCQPIPFRVPAMCDGTPAIDGHVELRVRLAQKDEPKVGQVAVFRGPGMVLRYQNRSRLALNMRPFHAVLACGTARDKRHPTDADQAIERFLRLAEPPSHDSWRTTQRLKDTYRRGYAKALSDLDAEVRLALRALLVARSVDGKKGPDRLQRRFPIGKKGAASTNAAPFQIRDMSAVLETDGWHFSGVVEPEKAAGRPWQVEVRASELDERGNRLNTVPIIFVEVSGKAAGSIVKGVAIVDAPASMRRMRVQARTAPAVCLSALEVHVVGRFTTETP